MSSSPVPVGRLVGRDVGQVEQPGAHLIGQDVDLGRGRPLLFAQLAAAGGQLAGPRVVAGLLGLADLAGELLDLRPHGLGRRDPGLPRRIGRDHGVHLGCLHPPPGQRSLHRIGFLTEQPDIDHLDRK